MEHFPFLLSRLRPVLLPCALPWGDRDVPPWNPGRVLREGPGLLSVPAWDPRDTWNGVCCSGVSVETRGGGVSLWLFSLRLVTGILPFALPRLDLGFWCSQSGIGSGIRQC